MSLHCFIWVLACVKESKTFQDISRGPCKSQHFFLLQSLAKSLTEISVLVVGEKNCKNDTKSYLKFNKDNKFLSHTLCSTQMICNLHF